MDAVTLLILSLYLFPAIALLDWLPVIAQFYLDSLTHSVWVSLVLVTQVQSKSPD
jgi:hypothetical protein